MSKRVASSPGAMAGGEEGGGCKRKYEVRYETRSITNYQEQERRARLSMERYLAFIQFWLGGRIDIWGDEILLKCSPEDFDWINRLGTALQKGRNLEHVRR